eukprot:jgi/Phyca11/113484/e_gw1.24.564.1
MVDKETQHTGIPSRVTKPPVTNFLSCLSAAKSAPLLRWKGCTSFVTPCERRKRCPAAESVAFLSFPSGPIGVRTACAFSMPNSFSMFIIMTSWPRW